MKSKEPLLKHSQKLSENGFTIVELLVVIVVIGILAAITIVSYTGITQKAVASSLQSDLSNASQQLKIFQIENSAYPTANNCPAPTTGEICLKSSSGAVYDYKYNNISSSQTFCISEAKNNQVYRVTQADKPLIGGCIVSSGLAMHFDATNGSSYSGNKLIDLSGYGNDGTIVSGVTYDSNESGTLIFDGSSYISVPNFLNQTTIGQEWTIGALVKIDSTAPVAAQKLINFNSGAYLVYANTSKLLLYLNSATNDYYDYGNFNLRDGKWHVVYFVFQNSIAKREIYVDDIDVSTTGPNLTSVPSGLPATFNIGEGLVGKINDVHVYDRALNSAEIQQNFNALRVRYGL